jgi:hypothetical protein
MDSGGQASEKDEAIAILYECMNHSLRDELLKLAESDRTVRAELAAPCFQRRPKACFIGLRLWLLKPATDESRLQRWRPPLGQ